MRKFNAIKNAVNFGKGKKKMIYSFRQTNSGGYYCQPAKYIIVKDAKDSEHATEIALKAGMYLGGVAAGSDCSCCGDRWYGVSDEWDTMENALLAITHEDVRQDSVESDGVPHYIVVDDLDIEDTVLE
tara:strand:+ start:413 stop:796 length:384 start_codon:yes stop_codon:yes gene_type:complete